MKASVANPESIQRSYYSDTASQYDEKHTTNLDGEHFTALKLITAFSHSEGLQTFLDLGAGTGRGVRFLLDHGLQARGIEPVPELIQVAEKSGLPRGIITQGSGYSLPFRNASFDAVMEAGVLHHVQDPGRVVAEMIRVARKAIFLSDSNRFGQGCYAARLLKLSLYKSRLWNIFRWIQTRGRYYTISEGDGLAYSYSVFDSYHQLARWADQIILVPTSATRHAGWAHPLLTAPSVLLCALKH